MLSESETLISKLKVSPNSAGVLRDGGSLVCYLKDDSDKIYELLFPIIGDRSLSKGEIYSYDLPELFEGFSHHGKLLCRLNWAEAHRLLCLVESSNDYLVDMKKIAKYWGAGST